VCRDDPCRAVVGSYLVLRDVQHLTVAWARALGPRLLERLACGAVPVPSPDVAAASGGPTMSPLAPSPAPVVSSGAASPMPMLSVSPAPSAGLPSPPAIPAVSCPG
jgi:hypothetical protein